MKSQSPHLTVFGFEVRFELFFWLTTLFIAIRLGEQHWGYAALWIALATVSVLLHELGHAIAYRHYGAKARIAMTGFGGLTYGTETDHITPKQQIVISLAGSTIEMLVLGFPAMLIRSVWDPAYGSWAYLTLTWLIWINVTWALVNLAPVWPMDGGKVLEQVFIIRSGHNRMRLVHKISIATGAVAVLVCWNYGLRFGIFLFLFFIVMNLFGLQVIKTKKPYQLWPGLDSANGTKRMWEDDLVPQTVSKQQHVQNSFAALVDERTHDVDRHLAQISNAKRTSKKVQVLVEELSVWRELTDGRPDLAEQALGSVSTASATLQAVMALEAGELAIDGLAQAIMDEANHPASEQGIVWAARNGYIAQLTTNLLDRDTPHALGHAVRIESVLDAAGLHDERRLVASMI